MRPSLDTLINNIKMLAITKRADYFFNKLDYYCKRGTSLLKNKSYRVWKIFVQTEKLNPPNPESVLPENQTSTIH